MTVPKIGYRHVNFRENSLFWSYKNNEETKLSVGEVKFWLDTAKKEFFFKNKREINYRNTLGVFLTKIYYLPARQKDDLTSWMETI